MFNFQLAPCSSMCYLFQEPCFSELDLFKCLPTCVHYVQSTPASIGAVLAISHTGHLGRASAKRGGGQASRKQSSGATKYAAKVKICLYTGKQSIIQFRHLFSLLCSTHIFFTSACNSLSDYLIMLPLQVFL
jgi:hypothetical protein